jgi:hypothetical protein
MFPCFIQQHGNNEPLQCKKSRWKIRGMKEEDQKIYKRKGGKKGNKL